MAVRPERRRLGIGRALVNALVEAGQNRGSRAIFLEVRRSNAAAQKLYRALGFNALSVRHDYYAAPREDAIVMSMNFDPSKAAPLPVARTQREHHTVPLLRRESFGSLYHVLTFDAQQPVMAEAGQFAMVRGAEWGDSPLLPRPMSYLTAGSRPSILIKVVGDGTSRMAHAEPGELFTLLGPLGNRWRAPRPERTPVLVAGGVGVAPLLFLARELHAKGQRSIVLYGGRSERDLPLREDLACVSDLRMITEDGSCGEKGRVPDLLRDLLKTPVDVFTCGPDRMMAAVAELCGQANVPCEASLETPMACGYGVCLGCPVLTTSGQYLYACVEGPCVDAQRIDWNKAGHAPVRKSTFPGSH
ncbi:MAG TPA: GNAT family N-acetyltransferase, partial [Polyangiaceae bacterium]|nr:GNAT family N-acetyltransferase [Polyangiaceae bacterium]